jgi:hypothetical protein
MSLTASGTGPPVIGVARCIPTVGSLIAVTLPPATAIHSAGYGLSTLAPAQRAVAQRLSAMALRVIAGNQTIGPESGLTGHVSEGVPT